jgi:hypothetical protein
MTMPRRKGAVIPPAPRKTLLEWIELDNGNTTDFIEPACSPQAQAFHMRIFLNPKDGKGEDAQPLQPPPGLRLPPLG